MREGLEKIEVDNKFKRCRGNVGIEFTNASTLETNREN